MNRNLQSYLASRDYSAIADGAVQWIRSWFSENGPESPAVIGISGGKDSSVVAALCASALGKERVFGVLMPNGSQADIETSYRLIRFLGIRGMELNIQNSYRGVLSSLEEAIYLPPDGVPVSLTDSAKINLGPRLRMAHLYAVAQCINGRVSNNSNRSERFVGYSTKFGDSVGDFAPLAQLTKTEVCLIGQILGLPEEFTSKTPSDGLSGRTDEDALGFSYEMLDTYILTGTCPDADARARIEQRHQSYSFKLSPIQEYQFA